VDVVRGMAQKCRRLPRLVVAARRIVSRHRDLVPLWSDARGFRTGGIEARQELAVSHESERTAQLVVVSSGGWSDTAIVEGLLRHDPDAASALYDRIGERVDRIVWRMLGADAEHDDVVHEVFVAALGSIAALRNATSLEAWMVGITLNTVRQELRRRQRRRLFRRPEQERADEHPAGDPARQLLSRRFYATLERLGVDRRIAFTLRFVEGHSLAETAVELGCSLATAKRRIERARAAFMRQARRDPVLAAWIERDGHEPR
jgi:RNA polymerase sigma-70 factor (ECF subfamily)